MRSSATCVWVEDGTVVSAQARVGDVRVEPGFRGRIQRTIARLEDDTGSIDATWFGRRFIERRLPIGGEVVVSGKIKHFGRRLTLDNPEFQVLAGDDGAAPRRPDRAGLPADRRADRGAPSVGDPRGARQGRARLPGVPAGVDHRRGGASSRSPGRSRRPTTRSRSRAATRRCAAWRSTSCSRSSSGWSSVAGSGSARRRPSSRWTSARMDGPDGARRRHRPEVGARGRADARPSRTAMTAIRDDLERPTPMLRLLQGDVGSGKTAVAAYALAATARAGLQGALLAPTDLLARQHLETVGGLLEGVGIGVTLLTGLAQGRRQGQGARGDRVRSGARRGRHPRPDPGGRVVRGSRPRRHRRAASVRRRPARPARGQGRRPLAARPADDRDADPANPRPGPVRRPRRLRPANAAGRSRADPDRQEAPDRPRRRPGPGSARRRRSVTGRSWSCRSSRRAPTTARARSPPRARRSGSAALLAPAPRRHGPRPDEGRRSGRRNDPLPRRRARRARRDDRDRGRRRRPGGDDDDHRGRRPVRAGPAPPAPRARRSRVGRVVLRPRLRLDRRDRAGAAARRSTETHDGFALAEKDFELRKEGDVLGLAQSGFPRLRVASLQVAAHRELAVRARAHAEACSMRRAGSTRRARPSPRSSSPAGSGASRPREPASGV